MALLDEQPYIGYPQMGRRRAMPNRDVEMNQGLLRGASYYPYDLLGSPIDLINMGLKPIGLGSEKPVMGSDYLQSLAQQYGLSQQPTRSNAENVARLAMSAINPATGARVAGKVIEPTMQALGPKAYGLLEDYMVKSGGMIPLTAYHGSPSNFTNFDKSRIGSGSGLDYGYGGYFAESPETAKAFSVLPNQSEFIRLGDKVVKTASQEGQFLNDVYKLGRKEAIKKYPDQADYIKTINPNDMSFEGGNLYKVDIPDEYVPKMINWSSSEQTPEVDKILKKAGLPSNARGEDIYFAAIDKAGSSDAEKSGFQKAAEYLDALGIKGITYPQRNYENSNVTKNFVVFDPTDVKILEKNNQAIEGLLD